MSEPTTRSVGDIREEMRDELWSVVYSLANPAEQRKTDHLAHELWEAVARELENRK